jgi:hypothetical protein
VPAFLRVAQHVHATYRKCGAHFEFRTEEVNGRLFGDIDPLVPILWISSGGGGINEESVIDMVQARLGKCHGVFEILVQYIPLAIVAARKLEARLDSNLSGG